MIMRSIRTSIFLIILALVCVGIVMIYSASAIYSYSNTGDSLYYLKRHLIYLGIGFLMMLGAMAIDTRFLQKHAKTIIGIAIVLLALVLVPHIGKEIGGAKRWFRLGVINFQPSEFAKIAIIVYMADLIARKGDRMKQFFFGFLPAMVVLGLVVGLILLEPDLGTAVTITVITLILLFIGGARGSYILASLLASVPVLYVLILSAPYRRRRIMAFLDPWADKRGVGFQIIQSFVALGSGGLIGVGLGQSRQKLFYLPASHTDFIFSIIGEELGFLGTVSILTLFALFVWQGMKIACKTIGSFEKILSMGIVSLIAFETIINIGVTAGSFPTKGLPLPFISYGGSGLIFHLTAIGLLLNVAKVCETYR